LKIGEQFIGIIGEGFEIGALENDGASVVGRIHADSGARIRDFYFLLFDLMVSGMFICCSWARHDLDIFFGKKSETFCDSL